MTASAFSPSVLTIPSPTSGNGQGELNLITNPVAVTDTTGWVGAGRGTSGGPLNPTIETYFTVLNTAGAESSTSGAYDVLSLPSGLQNKKLKVEFYFTSPAADTFKVSVYKGTTRVPLTTDVSGSTALPQNTTGKFVAYFDTDSSGTWTVSITRTAGTGGTALQFTNVVVGPGIQPQGAVVGEWQSYTPTITGYGTVTNVSMNWMRIGRNIRVLGRFTAGTVAATAASITLPSSLNSDSSVVNVGGFVAGQWWVNVSAGTVYKRGVILASNVNSNTLVFSVDDYTNAISPFTGQNGSTIGSSSNVLEVDFTVPIAEWAGSGTVQLAQNDVEYAWNSGNVTAANGADTSSFGYGPSGTPILAYTSNAISNNYSTNFSVRFQTPIQAGDAVVLELNNTAGGNSWVPAITTVGFTTAGTASYGASLGISNPTTVTVSFGNAGFVSTGTYGAAGGAWGGLVSSGYRWRVRKSSAGAAVGFGIVAPGVSSGLVSASGLPGNTSGSPIASGYVGEVLVIAKTSNIGTSSTGITAGTLPLTAGVWRVSIRGATLYASGGVSALEWAAKLTTNASLNPATTDYYSSIEDTIGGGNSTGVSTIQCRTTSSADMIINVATSTTYYLRLAYAATGGGSIGVQTYGVAVRIA